MVMDPRLLELLVCPICKGPLAYRRPPLHKGEELVCAADRLAFPVRDGIPVMLESQARSIEREDEDADARTALNGPGTDPSAVPGTAPNPNRPAEEATP
jgi:uncharacterized protein YbaR (Trm112 family)